MRHENHKKAKTEDCIHTDLYDKSHCVEVVYPLVLEESKNIVNGSTLGIFEQNIKKKHTSSSPLKSRKCVPVGGL